jgi:hypothetical protein
LSSCHATTDRFDANRSAIFRVMRVQYRMYVALFGQ